MSSRGALQVHSLLALLLLTLLLVSLKIDLSEGDSSKSESNPKAGSKKSSTTTPPYVDRSGSSPTGTPTADMEAIIDKLAQQISGGGSSSASSASSTGSSSASSSSSKSSPKSKDSSKIKSSKSSSSKSGKAANSQSSSSSGSESGYVKRPPNPSQRGLSRDSIDGNEIIFPPLTKRATIKGGVSFLGTQMDLDGRGKVVPHLLTDGSHPRIKVMVHGFNLDVDCVSNMQFEAFVKHTGYQTDSELYQWSFVLDSQVSAAVKAEVDGSLGYGRVKDSHHWMGVKRASWKHPFGDDSEFEQNMPAVHISYNDAVEYCTWAGLRLPTGHEWEFAARGGLINNTYPWGKNFDEARLNIWSGKFPNENTLLDGFHGPAPVGDAGIKAQNSYGLYNMVGNVWEWVVDDMLGERRKKKKDKDQPYILRGGSFLDSKDGSFNHLVSVATQQTSTADSAASNIGFRCAEDSEDFEEMKNSLGEGVTVKDFKDVERMRSASPEKKKKEKKSKTKRNENDDPDLEL